MSGNDFVSTSFTSMNEEREGRGVDASKTEKEKGEVEE